MLIEFINKRNRLNNKRLHYRVVNLLRIYFLIYEMLTDEGF